MNLLKDVVRFSLIFVCLSSCTEEDSGEPEIKKSPKVVLDLSDAKSLTAFQTPNVEYEFGNLYKITSAGVVKKLAFTDPNGSEALPPGASDPTVYADVALNLNESYVLLSGVFKTYDTLGLDISFPSLIVRKDDGAIFKFGNFDVDLFRHRLGESPVRHNESDDIFYSDGSGVIKLSLSDPEKLTKSEYLPIGEDAQYFEVDNDGNVIYQYGESAGVTNSNGTTDLRIRKASGGLFEVKVAGRDNKSFWLGSNGKFYFVTYQWDNGYLPKIHRININGATVSIEDVWGPDNASEYIGVGGLSRRFSEGSYVIKKSSSVVFVDTYYEMPGFSWEFFEADNRVEPISLPDIAPGAIVVNSNDYYYISTGPDLYKVSLADHSYTKLFTTGAYEIYSMHVDNENNLLFNGLRVSDGKKIFAQINSSGTLTVINDQLNKEAILLEKLD